MNQQFQQGEIRSRFPPRDRPLYDFYRINDWSVDGHREAHRADLAWLNEQVDLISRSEPERKIVILTHHSPCLDGGAMDPRQARSAVSSAFATNVSNEARWKIQSVKVWAFEQTHFNRDYEDEEAAKWFVTD
ncbi:hypothetical protein FQN52_009095 [Onygenales sp. PD_12]|nr:hypothetical protein FQN52_009095 [Onygenales sp. PD_12]